jgi:hypothetical protein
MCRPTQKDVINQQLLHHFLCVPLSNSSENMTLYTWSIDVAMSSCLQRNTRTHTLFTTIYMYLLLVIFFEKYLGYFRQ